MPTGMYRVQNFVLCLCNMKAQDYLWSYITFSCITARVTPGAAETLSERRLISELLGVCSLSSPRNQLCVGVCVCECACLYMNTTVYKDMHVHDYM